MFVQSVIKNRQSANLRVKKKLNKPAKEPALAQFKHTYIGAMLSITKGNITQAARRCAMDRRTLQQIMKRYAIDPEKFRKKSS